MCVCVCVLMHLYICDYVKRLVISVEIDSQKEREREMWKQRGKWKEEKDSQIAVYIDKHTEGQTDRFELRYITR